jgi:D-inositol-3-phosphate glycosyltransferase
MVYQPTSTCQNSKLKIAIIGPAWPYRGGIATFNEYLAEILLSQGHEVHIHTFSKQYPGFLFPGTSQFTDKPCPKGLQIERSLHAYNPLTWPGTQKKLVQQQYDLVIIRYWIPAMSPVLSSMASALSRSGSRVVALVDNLYPHEARPFDRWLTRLFLPHPHAFLAISKVVRTQLLELVGDRRVYYTPHPIYDNYGPALDQLEARKQLELPEKERIILFFGFIRRYKGLDLLLEAIADKRFQDQDVKLVVAGEWYEDSASYRAIVDRHKLSDRIIWMDHFIPETQVAALFSAADAVIQPYRSATQSGISALAYAYRKPLISTDVGGLSEVVVEGKTGFLCEPEPGSIADAIHRFLANTNTGMLSAINEQAQLMSWEHLSECIIEAADTK